MSVVLMQYGLFLAAVLFALGPVGVLVRRNLIFMLMSIEIMLNAAGLAFVVAGSRWGQPDGQVMFIFILAMAAAEVAVGLALILRLYQRLGTLDVDAARPDARLTCSASCCSSRPSRSPASSSCRDRRLAAEALDHGGGRRLRRFSALLALIVMFVFLSAGRQPYTRSCGPGSPWPASSRRSASTSMRCRV